MKHKFSAPSDDGVMLLLYGTGFALQVLINWELVVGLVREATFQFWLSFAAVVATIFVLAFLINEPAYFQRILIRKKVRTKRISKAPGTRLLAIVDFIFSPATVEETFKPTVADWHEEYFEALRQKRFLKARWISVRYTYRFILAMGLSKVFSVIKSFKSVIK